MIAFVILAAAMVAAALAWVLVPLLRRHERAAVDRAASNLSLLREQRQELDGDLARGVLTPERYTQALAELERSVLDETSVTDEPTGTPISSTWSAVVMAAGIPIIAVVLYLTLGSRDAFSPPMASAAAKGGEHPVTPAEIESMAAQLTAKLKQDPNNAEGWVMLARTYYALKRFPDAAGAFERAVALVPDNAALLSDYADTLGSAQGGTLAGKPTELVNRALKIDPNYWKALALAGTAAFDAKDYRGAVEYWERCKNVVPAESDFAKGLDASIAEARELGGMAAFAKAPAAAPAATMAAAAPSASAAPAKPAPAATGAKTLVGTVRLAPSMAAKAAPDDVVFVFARAAQGSRMPLALVRAQVKDLPYQFTLDDSSAMAPEMTLSKASEVVVGARVSKSGQVMPATGDLEGVSAPVRPGATGVAVVIDKTLP